MEFVGGLVAMTFVVLLFSYVVNNDYWRAYHNSKFIDEFLKDEKENKSVFSVLEEDK